MAARLVHAQTEESADRTPQHGESRVPVLGLYCLGEVSMLADGKSYRENTSFDTASIIMSKRELISCPVTNEVYNILNGIIGGTFAKCKLILYHSFNIATTAS